MTNTIPNDFAIQLKGHLTGNVRGWMQMVMAGGMEPFQARNKIISEHTDSLLEEKQRLAEKSVQRNKYSILNELFRQIKRIRDEFVTLTPQSAQEYILLLQKYTTDIDKEIDNAKDLVYAETPMPIDTSSTGWFGGLLGSLSQIEYFVKTNQTLPTDVKRSMENAHSDAYIKTSLGNAQQVWEQGRNPSQVSEIVETLRSGIISLRNNVLSKQLNTKEDCLNAIKEYRAQLFSLIDDAIGKVQRILSA